MKLSKIILAMPSPYLRTVSVLTDTHDLDLEDGNVMATPRAGGKVLVWPFSHISEAWGLEDAPVPSKSSPVSEQAKVVSIKTDKSVKKGK